MTPRRQAALSFLVAALACLVFSWPLARHFGSGIPSSSSNIEKDNVRAMIPGDHLQFLYHMWLAKDTFAGPTPLFHNLYEFNTGDDAERYEVRPYYLPFSLFFTVGSLVGGQAFGWNFAILITFWLTYWFAWKLARRYHPDPWVSAIIALFPVAFPFPWIVLLGGSPTGFAMMWVPILLYGLDRWVAERSYAGAALAGAAIFFAEWGDTHVFFFNALLAPAWCLWAYLYHHGWTKPARPQLIGWLRSSVFLALFLGLAAYKALSVQQDLQGTPIAKGRSLSEVALNSHSLNSLVSLRVDGDGRKTYVSVYGLLLLAGALAIGVRRIRRDRRDMTGWCLTLLVLGIGGIFLLSTGVKNPLGPRAWQILMKAVPPYGMIRQPDKIFCLVPTLLLVVSALVFARAKRCESPVLARFAAGALLLPLFLHYAGRLNTTICQLDPEQGAYRAVAERAAAEDRVPRAIVIPLWPGNSHFASLYEYYVSLYRIRMVNGYRPTPRQVYLDTIFEPLQSINSGYPDDAQLDDLLARGVDHVLLHEDAFPEKVSGYPVGVTLANLLGHPRLKFLAQDGPVWSFAILAQPDPAAAAEPMNVPYLFPTRSWEWERSSTGAEKVVEDAAASGGKFLQLTYGQKFSVTSQPVRTAGPIPVEWHVRVRGKGTLNLRALVNGQPFYLLARIDSTEWTWHRLVVPEIVLNAQQQLVASVSDGQLDLDVAMLTREGWREWAVGQVIHIPAVSFFRAGYTAADRSSVALRTTHDPADQIFYSRHLYLAPGRYRVSMRFQSEAADGAELGRMEMRSMWPDTPDTVATVLAGQPAVMEYQHRDNRFFRFGFTYTRNADMTIAGITLERIE